MLQALPDLFSGITGDDPVLLGLLGGCVTALMNTFGAPLASVSRGIMRHLDVTLG